MLTLLTVLCNVYCFNLLTKSCIQETLNLSTDVGMSTISQSNSIICWKTGWIVFCHCRTILGKHRLTRSLHHTGKWVFCRTDTLTLQLYDEIGLVADSVLDSSILSGLFNFPLISCIEEVNRNDSVKYTGLYLLTELVYM